MRITEEQKQFLNSFVCERLTGSLENLEAVRFFHNAKGSLIVEYLQRYGETEDKAGETNYYVIKAPTGEPMMFFSLKCGALFHPLFDEEEYIEGIQRKQILLQALHNELEDQHKAEIIVKKLQLRGYGSSRIEIEQIISGQQQYKMENIMRLRADQKAEENELVTRVENTFPGIELVHFCTNDGTKEMWRGFRERYQIRHTLGQVMYWKFIVPILFNVQELVGCKYVFLFAADYSENADLVNYYDVSLKFKKTQEVGTAKPVYDFGCHFMCQEINELKRYRQEFFEDFNPDENSPVV